MKEIFAVKEYEKSGENKSIWIRIGTGFENQDGSINLVFDTFPVSKDLKTIQVREHKPKDERAISKSKGGRFTDAELEPDNETPF